MADSAAVAALKAKYKLSEAQYKALASAWSKGAEQERATQKSLGELRAKRATDFTKNAAGYVKARDSGTSAARVRAAVELAKLKTLAPVEFAKAATLPDRNLQTTLTQGLSAAGLAETPDKDVDKARKAWQMFLTTVQPSSANVLGSYEWMVNTYGDPSYLGVNDGPLRDKLAEVLQKVDVERKNAAEFDTSLEKVGTSWATFLRNNPNLDPEADSTFEIFQRDAPIDLSIIPGAGSAFMQNIESVAKNPEAHPEFFADIDTDIKESNEEQKRYEDKLEGLSVLDIEGAPGEAQDDSMRAYLAAWVRRPDVQWWAEKNGFELGKAEPIDPESDFGKEVAAGRVPGQMIVNGMLYRMRPDDLRAFRLAHAQVTQDPEDNIFRALGLAHKTGPRRMVEVEEIVEPGTPDLKLVKRGLDDAGAIAVDAEGNFHTSTDGRKTWAPANKAEAQARMDAAEKAGDVDATPVTVPGVRPTTRTRQLEYREPIYKRDAPNSVRGVDPETGKEVYIPPEQVAKVAFPGGEPKRGATLVDRINQVSAKATLKKGVKPEEKPAKLAPGGEGTASGQRPDVLSPTAGFDHREAARPAPGSATPAPAPAPATPAPAAPKKAPLPVELTPDTSGLRAPASPTLDSAMRVAMLKARKGLDAAKVASVPDVPRREPPRPPPIGEKPEAQEVTPVPDASGLKAPSTKAQPGVSARDVLNTEGRKVGVLENAAYAANVGVDRSTDIPTASVKPGPSGNAPAPLVREEDVAFKPASADIEVHTTTTPTASTVAAAQKKALEESRKRQKAAEVAKQAQGAGASPGATL